MWQYHSIKAKCGLRLTSITSFFVVFCSIFSNPEGKEKWDKGLMKEWGKQRRRWGGMTRGQGEIERKSDSQGRRWGEKPCTFSPSSIIWLCIHRMKHTTAEHLTVIHCLRPSIGYYKLLAVCSVGRIQLIASCLGQKTNQSIPQREIHLNGIMYLVVIWPWRNECSFLPKKWHWQRLKQINSWCTSHPLLPEK